MLFRSPRVALVCQQATVLAAVAAVGLSATGVVRLDVVPPSGVPASPAGTAEGASLVSAAPVEPAVAAMDDALRSYLERMRAKGWASGDWQPVRENLGFPAGKNKDVVIELPAEVLSGSSAGSRKLRLRTNLEIYWDALGWCYAVDDVEPQVTPLPVEVADLRYRGYSKLLPLDRRRPPWATTVFQGYRGSGSAMHVRVHHSIGDGLRRVMQAQTGTSADTGPIRFARYAYPPNRLGLCGPADAPAYSSQGPSVQFSVPEESPGPPFYSITGNGGFLAHDGEWTFIPFLMIMLLAGLQALPKEVLEAAKVDGATAWQNFWAIIFPLMLPVSLTASFGVADVATFGDSEILAAADQALYRAKRSGRDQWSAAEA